MNGDEWEEADVVVVSDIPIREHLSGIQRLTRLGTATLLLMR